MHTVPHVVIIGGGFGGLETAKALASMPVRVTLVDRSNHHLFQPLLYQVATAGLSPAEIAIPIRSVLRWADNVRVIMATVTEVHLSDRRIRLDDRDELTYDWLVIAAGAQASYFGRDEWAKHAIPLKTVEDATRIRRDVLLAFEHADRLKDPEERRRHLTFVVIGGGPTGVELAGALSELTRRVLSIDFAAINPDEPRIVLVEGSERLLGGMSAQSSEIAVQSLRDMGVDVRLGQLAREINEQGVHLAGEVIETDTVIWAAGVSANGLAQQLGVETDRAGRIATCDDCSVPGFPEVFAIGDIAAFRQKDGRVLPGVSPVAMQQGRYVAKVVQCRLNNREPPKFAYVDKGSMATIGRSRAVAEVGRMRLRGLSAWLTWLVVHLWFLVGFKNRVFVLLQWVFSYVFYRRGARLITHVNYEEDGHRRAMRREKSDESIPHKGSEMVTYPKPDQSSEAAISGR